MCKYYSFSRLNELEDYKDLTDKKLLEMCIMAGCDYLPNMENIGIRKGYDEIVQWESYAEILRKTKTELKLRTETEAFEKNKQKIERSFEKAILAFTYQQVYDPMSQTCERLSHINYELLRSKKAEFLGPFLNDKSVHDIATGKRSSEINETDHGLELKSYPQIEDVVSHKRTFRQMSVTNYFMLEPNYKR